MISEGSINRPCSSLFLFNFNPYCLRSFLSSDPAPDPNVKRRRNPDCRYHAHFELPFWCELRAHACFWQSDHTADLRRASWQPSSPGFSYKLQLHTAPSSTPVPSGPKGWTLHLFQLNFILLNSVHHSILSKTPEALIRFSKIYALLPQLPPRFLRALESVFSGSPVLCIQGLKMPETLAAAFQELTDTKQVGPVWSYMPTILALER